MDIKVRNSGRASETGKKSKTSRTGQTGGVSFASLLESATGADDIEQTLPAGGIGSIATVFPDAIGDDVPQDAKSRGAWMLEKLEELQADILTGNPTEAAAKLKRALDSAAIDRDQLPPQLKALVDEIDLRASVEIAKLDAGKKRNLE